MDIDAKDIQNHGLSQKTNGHGDWLFVSCLFSFISRLFMLFWDEFMVR